MQNEMERFRQTFIAESFELLEEMEERLLSLEAHAFDSEVINAIFRCAHSIKGGAGIFGFTRITGFTHILEALLDRMRDGKVAITPEAIGVLLEAGDIVKQMVIAARDEVALPAEYGKAIAEKLHAVGDQSSVEAAAPSVAQAPAEAENKGAVGYDIRFVPHLDIFATGNEPLLLLKALGELGPMSVICHSGKVPLLEELNPLDCHLGWDISLTTDKGEADIREVFEFVEDECELTVSAKQETAEAADAEATAPEPAIVSDKVPAAGETPPSAEAPAKNAAAISIRVDIEKIDRLINMVGEIVITQTMLMAQAKNLPADEFTDLHQGIDALAQHTRELQEAVMTMRMQPVKSIFARMPRLVRDISGKLGKNIRLETRGEETEVDKTVIEQLADPLTHMIRNSVDHGIESPEKRLGAGKPEQGTISLAASHSGGRILIEVSDDGGGINRERVLEKARAKGLVTADAVLAEEEIDQLIFAPGFSTAETVSDISGRGVGMDVVRRNIEAIGGVVTIHNRPGQGSAFRVSLPLTLAILDAMIVRVGGEFYIIPISSIVETMRPKPGEVKHIVGGPDVINVRGDILPLIYLHALFGIRGAAHDPASALVVLTEGAQGVSGIVVDELIGQQQIVIKSLETNLDPVPGVSGATILGDGRVALILDIPALPLLGRDAAPSWKQAS